MREDTSVADTIHRRHLTLVGVLLAAAALSGCGGSPAGTTSDEPSATPTASEASATEAPSATATASASASAAAEGSCLEADVVAALDELDSGNLATDPAPAEVADALDALELDGPAAEARDNTVATLRESPLNEAGVMISLQMLYSQVALPEC
jgi:hypothetical protein